MHVLVVALTTRLRMALFIMASQNDNVKIAIVSLLYIQKIILFLQIQNNSLISFVGERISLRGIARVTGVSWSWLQNCVNQKLSRIPRQIKVSAKMLMSVDDGM